MSDDKQSGSSALRKFAVALNGIIHAVKHENSFLVHLSITATVIAVGFWLQLEAWRWVAVTLSIALVISAELMNTAIEELVAVLHPQHDPRIGRVLDIAAGAVLIASAGAVVAGMITLAMPLWNALS